MRRNTPPKYFSTVIKVDKTRFLQLINALERGWEIEEPVLLGVENELYPHLFRRSC